MSGLGPEGGWTSVCLPVVPISRLVVGVQLPGKSGGCGCVCLRVERVKGDFRGVLLGVVDILAIVEVASLKLCALDSDGARPCRATTW